jgi:hypothetical protein
MQAYTVIQSHGCVVGWEVIQCLRPLCENCADFDFSLCGKKIEMFFGSMVECS